MAGKKTQRTKAKRSAKGRTGRAARAAIEAAIEVGRAAERMRSSVLHLRIARERGKEVLRPVRETVAALRRGRKTKRKKAKSTWKKRQ